MRHLDPTFIKKRIQNSPEAAGKNFMSYICCNYWLVKTFAEPFLNTSHTVQTLIYSSAECAHKCRSRLSCIGARDVESGDDEVNSKFEDERKGRNSTFTSTMPTSLVAKCFYYTAVAIAYSILVLFIVASFSV